MTVTGELLQLGIAQIAPKRIQVDVNHSVIVETVGLQIVFDEGRDRYGI
jgi:hypothetical protein